MSVEANFILVDKIEDECKVSTANVVDEVSEIKVQERIRHSPLANLIAKHLMKKNIKIVVP